MKYAAFALLAGVACTSAEAAQDGGSDAGAADTTVVADVAVDVVDGDATSSTPIDIFGPRLVAWYDASDSQSVGVDGGVVVEWRDRSVWHNRHMTALQGALGVHVEPAAANGHPAIHVGAQYGCFVVGSPPLREDTVLVIIAAYNNGVSREGILWATPSTAPNDGVFLTANVAGTTRVYAGLAQWPDGVVSGKVGLNDGQLHAITLRGNGMLGTVRIRVDGLEGAADSGVGAGSDRLTWIGGEQPMDAGVQSAVEGYMAEVIVARLPTDGEVALLAKYIGEKYGIVL